MFHADIISPQMKRVFKCDSPFLCSGQWCWNIQKYLRFWTSESQPNLSRCSGMSLRFLWNLEPIIKRQTVRAQFQLLWFEIQSQNTSITHKECCPTFLLRQDFNEQIIKVKVKAEVCRPSHQFLFLLNWEIQRLTNLTLMRRTLTHQTHTVHRNTGQV